MKLLMALAISLLSTSATIVTPLSAATEYRFVQNQLVQNLNPQEVNLRAKQITVRIDGAGIGTGVIIDESKTAYTILTNWHVVKESGEYIVQTIDGRKHPVDYNTVKQLPNLDLAILQFERKRNYQIAEIGNSRSLIEGQNLYFAGYPGELRKEDNRYYRFFPANLVGILPKSTANGYSLIYNGEAFPGMSGSPVFDSQGLLIAIHGETNIHAITGGTSNYAIPISDYQNAIAKIETADNSDRSNNSSPATPSVTVNTSAPEQNTPQEDTSSQNRTIVEAESSPNDESKVTVNNEENSQNNTTTPLNSEVQSNNNNDLDSSKIVSVPTLTTTPRQPVRSQNKPLPSSPIPVTKPDLLSSITGIDYTPLKQLLVSKKWQEADRQTQTLIARVIETAKRQGDRQTITIREIADYSCQDMYIIDSIWQQYTNKKFGFTPQQEIWQNNKQNNDFSPNTWRSFATQLGWKEGDINNSGGYLLYEQLTFNPQTAPQGHLPWWFAASEEQQKTIKTVLTRCSLEQVENPNEETNSDNSESKKNNSNEPNRQLF